MVLHREKRKRKLNEEIYISRLFALGDASWCTVTVSECSIAQYLVFKVIQIIELDVLTKSVLNL